MKAGPIGLLWSLFQEIKPGQFLIICRLGVRILNAIWFALASPPREVCAVAGWGKDLHSKG